MDHMLNSGNDPSSEIHSKTKWFQKLKMISRKCLNKLKQKGWCKKKTHKIAISGNFNTENFDALKTLRINRSRS